MLDKKGRYIIEDYQKQPAFASFLPGIAGTLGIPMWCFYVNRGQAVAGFGSQDKEHAIMEFYPAQKSYQTVKLLGFRTFVKLDGRLTEPFSDPRHRQDMAVGMNELLLRETDPEQGFEMTAEYCILPEEPVGALIRHVTITNISAETRKAEVMDGMPAVIPYGIGYRGMKDMTETMKAWMTVKNTEEKLPYFTVNASTGDSAVVEEIREGNFFFACGGKEAAAGTLLPVIVDPKLLFGFDTSLTMPLGFCRQSLAELLGCPQQTGNQVPCAFAAVSGVLAPGESLVLTEVIGRAADPELVSALSGKAVRDGNFAALKRERAEALTASLTDLIETHTGDPVFDAYCRQTYLDNVLRGGHPIRTGDKLAYIYSRKHGDLERDYNFFSMLPEYFSQGNGNYRDICQNRRSDVRYLPYTGDYNIRLFMELLQMDGYNPLVLNKVVYHCSNLHAAETLLRENGSAKQADRAGEAEESGQGDKIRAFFADTFTLGTLCRFLEEWVRDASDGAEAGGAAESACRASAEMLFGKIVSLSEQVVSADFTEGYWTDHWGYNLDLLESYLSIYPEQEENLLWQDRSYRYYDSGQTVLPRKKRYVRTAEGIRQYRFLSAEPGSHDWTRKADGTVYESSLMAKLLLLISCKLATLDMDGTGIEMEAGKPGWYDALNGLPGLLGSSVPETCELLRLITFLLNRTALEEYDVSLPAEGEELFAGMEWIAAEMQNAPMQYWNRSNDLKEAYREAVRRGIRGEEIVLTGTRIRKALELWEKMLMKRIRKAAAENGGICPTYFYYEAEQFTETAEGIRISRAKRHSMPLFLEGPVHFMKLAVPMEEKRQQYRRIRESALYDQKLSMYKVNASLAGCSLEIGRCRAFTPGWLENESIWLHMEYKYLLELLKNGMYREFSEDFRKAGIPFQPYERYGRSPLENVSFIASSAYTEADAHGRGFVSRLSGSTAEFLEIWQRMMFGPAPFAMRGRVLVCRFAPQIPQWLIPADGTVRVKFLGTTELIYHFAAQEGTAEGTLQSSSGRLPRIEVTFAGDEKPQCFTGEAAGEAAIRIRRGEAGKIEVFPAGRP